MKRSYMYLLLAIATASGCSKDKAGSAIDDPDPIDPITINVLERSTNKPVAGATVYLKNVQIMIFYLDVPGIPLSKILNTNTAGQVTITDPAPVDAIEIQHSKYWASYTNSISDISLTPKCIIQVSIKRIKTYAPNDILYIGQHVSDCYPPSCYMILEPVGLPLDTVIFLKGAGYFDNHISWYINYLSTDTLHTTPPFYINGFDSAKVDIEY